MKLGPGGVGIVVAVPVIIVLTACGSSAPRSSRAGPTTSSSVATTTTRTTVRATTTTGAEPLGNFDSCTVVTQAEAASAIGESVTQGVDGRGTVRGGLACVFFGPSAPNPTDANFGAARLRSGVGGQGLRRPK